VVKFTRRKYQLIKIRHHYPENSLKDINKACRQEFTRISGLIPGKVSIAIAVGSRGIDNLLPVVREVVDLIKKGALHPLLFRQWGAMAGQPLRGKKRSILLERTGS